MSDKDGKNLIKIGKQSVELQIVNIVVDYYPNLN